MTTSVMPTPLQRYFTNSGTPAAGCKLHTYAAGTTTPKQAFQDAAGLVPHTNPITLDAKGEALVYWDGNYKIDLKTAAGVQITGYPVDNVASYVPVVFMQAGAGAVARTLGDKLRESVTPEDFGAVGDGIADETNAFAALNVALIALGGAVVSLRKKYKLPGGWDLPVGNVSIYGFGAGEIIGQGTTGPGLSATGKNNITVDGLKVSLPRTNLRSAQFATKFTTGNGIRFMNCRTDGGAVGFWSIDCLNVLVSGCYIDTPKADGIHFGHGSRQCTAIGNTVVNAGDDAFSTTYYDGYPNRPKNISFIGNTVIGSLWGYGIAFYSCDNGVATGNNISGTALGGIQVSTNGAGTVCTKILVADNLITNVCTVEKQPDSYWTGSDPALDPLVTSQLHKSAIAIIGNDITVRGNSITSVTGLAGQIRWGLSAAGVIRPSICGNTFADINGDGVNISSGVAQQIHIDNNTFESVLGVAIRTTVALTTAFSVCGNTSGFGQTLSGEPYMVYMLNAGAALGAVNNNSSSGGRGFVFDASATNTTKYRNSIGLDLSQSYVPVVTSVVGAITSYTIQSAKFTVSGQLVFVNLQVLIVDNGTGSDAINVTLPSTAAVQSQMCGREGNVTGNGLTGDVVSGTNIVKIRTYNNGYPGAANARINIAGFYEAVA